MPTGVNFIDSDTYARYDNALRTEMKHGDKTKGKASKASGKKAGSSAGKSSKAGDKIKAVVAKAKSALTSKASIEKTAAKQAPAKQAGNGSAARARGNESGFSNPAVGAAFKTAVKKYPNAFRKLTD